MLHVHVFFDRLLDYLPVLVLGCYFINKPTLKYRGNPGVDQRIRKHAALGVNLRPANIVLHKAWHQAQNHILR